MESTGERIANSFINHSYPVVCTLQVSNVSYFNRIHCASILIMQVIIYF